MDAKADELTISASEFKAKCLDILDRLGDRRLREVVVTKRGKPVAVLTPPKVDEEAVRNIFGSMRGTFFIPDDIDLTEPIFDGVIEAAEGKLPE